jgi:hypothetical protein
MSPNGKPFKRSFRRKVTILHKNQVKNSVLFMWFILKQEDELSICANSQRGEGVCPTCGRL